jgi:hypothetical protein
MAGDYTSYPEAVCDHLQVKFTNLLTGLTKVDNSPDSAFDHATHLPLGAIARAPILFTFAKITRMAELNSAWRRFD